MTERTVTTPTLPLSAEGWKTVRAAIRGGWGPTLRLLIIITVPAVLMICAYLVVL